MRTTYDFAPLWRSTIGFDRLFDLVDAAQHGRYGGQLSTVQRRAPRRRPLPDLAGGRGFLTRRNRDHRRTKRADGGRPESREATARIPVPGNFVAALQAAVQPGGLCVQVKGAAFDNGLLQIELVREIPEAMKPRRISIAGSSASNVRQIDGQAAA